MAYGRAALPALGQGDEYELGPTGPHPLYDLEHDAKVIKWRWDCFVAAGVHALQANALSVRRDIDRVTVERVAAGLRAKGADLALVGAILL